MSPRSDGRGGDRSGPVLVRSVLDPPGTWTAQQAVDLLVQGYSVDRVVAVTGFDSRWVRYQAGRLDNRGTRGHGSARNEDVGR